MVFCACLVMFFVFKQKTAYEMRISDWSSDVCSSDLSYAILAGLDRVDSIQHPRAYLFQIARSQITRHVRRARIVSINAVADLERLEKPDVTPSPEQCAIDRDELRHLAHAIAAMHPQTREAFMLRRVQGQIGGAQV